jgi:hypothetical protein
MKIEKEDVVFNQFGQWSHSAVESLGEEFDEVPFAIIPVFANLELMPIRIYDDDKIDLLCGIGMDQGLADFRKWKPDPPEGDGWFPFTYSDDEDGPYVMYARAKDQTNGGQDEK